MIVKLYFIVKSRPNRTYPAMCKYSGFVNLNFTLGGIVLSDYIPSGVYQIACHIPGYETLYSTHMIIDS